VYHVYKIRCSSHLQCWIGTSHSLALLVSLPARSRMWASLVASAAGQLSGRQSAEGASPLCAVLRLAIAVIRRQQAT
jgi:hypothetical protein